MAYIPSSGSVLAIEGTTPWIITGSIQGTVSVLGAVPVTQSTTPWVISSVYGNFSGSVLSQQSGTRITSVVSANPSSMLVGASIFGQLPGGVATLGSVAAIVSNFPANQSVSGTLNVNSVLAFQGATWNDNISQWGGASVQTASVLQEGTTNPLVPYQGAFLMAFNGVTWDRVPHALPNVDDISTAAAASRGIISRGFGHLYNGTNWDRWRGNSSIGALINMGAGSIISTYAEDVGHTTGDRGIFTLAVRNDTVSSTVSNDLDYTAHAVDSAGRMLTKPFASEDANIISYVGSVVSASVTLIQASAIGKKSYITDFWIANTGLTAQLVTFQGGDTSVLGYTIAPAGSGSNSPGIAMPLKTTLSQDLTFKITGTSSVVYVTVKGYQAP